MRPNSADIIFDFSLKKDILPYAFLMVEIYLDGSPYDEDELANIDYLTENFIATEK